MKIIIISKNFPPKIDGVGDHTKNLCDLLRQKGHEVRVITSTSDAKSGDVTIYNPLESSKDIPAIRDHVDSFKPDYVIIQYVGYSFSKRGIPWWLVGLKSSFLSKNIKVILFVHETFERRKGKLKYRLISFFQKLCLKLITRKVYAILTNNDLYRKHLSFLNKEIVLARTPSNFEFMYRPETIKNEEKRSPLNIVSFGNRDYHDVIEFLSELNKKIPVKYSITGKLNAQLATEIKKKSEAANMDIELKGELEEGELLSEIDAADFFLLPEYISEYGEGGLNTKSGVSATAFMLGKIVISVKGDMTENIFEDGINCILVDLKNTKESAEKIWTIFNDKKRMAEMENKSSQFYKDHLAWSNTMNSLNAIIK